MQTLFTPDQRDDPEIREADAILRACVHCGFCTAACPTYVLGGDERDSPRGRIYLIKDMLEDGTPASDQVATHVDRCLSCLSCVSACPSGVDYMHLVDLARGRIERTRRRPLVERGLRAMLAWTLPHPARFRCALALARLARPLAPLLPARMRAMVNAIPAGRPPRGEMMAGAVFPAQGTRRRRVALLTGCVQQALAPEINAATIRLLTRHGCEVTVAEGAGCCGALDHHLGRTEAARVRACVNVAAWSRLVEDDGLDAVVVNASGCGTMVKDYGHLLRDDPEWAGRAARIADLARDVAEFAAGLDLMIQGRKPGLRLAYQSACSLRHGQGIDAQPRALLATCGFDVREPAEPHLCCGSAGTYNLLQPNIASRLKARKAAALDALAPDAIATGNIGCMMQLRDAVAAPMVHTAELLDWATGGEPPATLAGAMGANDGNGRNR